MTEQEIIDAVSEKLTSNRFYIGQRVRINQKFHSPYFGLEGTIGNVLSPQFVYVNLDEPPEPVINVTWHIDWLDPIQPTTEDQGK